MHARKYNFTFDHRRNAGKFQRVADQNFNVAGNTSPVTLSITLLERTYLTALLIVCQSPLGYEGCSTLLQSLPGCNTVVNLTFVSLGLVPSTSVDSIILNHGYHA
jgi:hypothetical protein